MTSQEPTKAKRRALRLRAQITPAVALFLLAPMIAELLSGSAPPAEFFNPLMFALLAVLYGSGAILIRELTVRLRKGWAAVLVLGAAYGIVEEGLMVKSFFDPSWVDLGILGSYGRWGGVNWVWSLELTVYHAVFSIAIPILLVSLMYPRRRAKPWLKPQALIVLLGLLIAEVAYVFLVLTPYAPPVAPYVVSLLVVVALVVVALRLPAFKSPYNAVSTTPRPLWFGVVGFFATLVFFLINWALPNTGIHPILTMLLCAAWVAFAGWAIWRMSGGGAGWSDLHRLALASGALTFFILLAPLQELDKNRPDNTTGMTLVGLAALIFLVWLALRVRRRETGPAAATG